MLLLLALALAAPCADLFAGARFAALNAPGAASALLDCMDSLLAVTAAERAETIATLQKVASAYAFVDDLKHPPAAFAAESPAVDIPALLARAGAETGTSAFQFYAQLQRVWALARDTHTSFTPPPELRAVRAVLPLCLRAEYSDAAPVIKTCAPQYAVAEAAAALGVDVPAGKTVTEINGQDAFAFLRDYADTRLLMGRDAFHRFEMLVGNQVSGPAWHMLMAPRADQLVDTSALDLTALRLRFADDAADAAPTVVPYAAHRAAANALEDLTWRPASQKLPPITPEAVRRARARASDAPKYVLFVPPAGDDLCKLIITTFMPAADDTLVWVDQLTTALAQMSAQQCGVLTGMRDDMPVGRRLVVDLRGNTGGAVVLAATLDALLFENTPPQTNVESVRLGDAATTDAFAQLLFDEPIVREPYTLLPPRACGGKRTVHCAKAWRGSTRTRANADGTAAQWSALAASGYFPWEVPAFASEEEMTRWATEGEGKTMYGYMAVYHGAVAMLRDTITKPEPVLTTFLLGPFSASASAGVATRALEYRQGTVVVTGPPQLAPLFAAQVPGGNVLALSEVAAETGIPALPRGADVSITNVALLPHTHDVAEAAGADTPLEFVALPPHHVLPYWASVSDLYSRAELAAVCAALLASPAATRCTPGLVAPSAECDRALFPHAASVGRACSASGRYNGACAVVRCELGFELQHGRCVDVGFLRQPQPGPDPKPDPTPDPPPDPQPDPRPARRRLSAVATATIALDCVLVVTLACIAWLLYRRAPRKGRYLPV